MKILFKVAFLSLVAAASHAHTQLSSSVPADEAVLESPPEQIVLHFSEPVRLTALSIEGAEAGKRDLGPLPSAPGAEFSVAASTLADGDYVVSWRALSADTHVMTGQFTFTLRTGAAAGEHSGH